MTDNDLKIIFKRNLLKYLGDTPQNEVAKSINVSPQTFNTWCQGIAMPRMGKLQKLADYFNIEISDLIEEKDAQLNNEQTEMLELFNSLNEDHKKFALENLKFLKAQET